MMLQLLLDRNRPTTTLIGVCVFFFLSLSFFVTLGSVLFLLFFLRRSTVETLLSMVYGAVLSDPARLLHSRWAGPLNKLPARCYQQRSAPAGTVKGEARPSSGDTIGRACFSTRT